ncbi:MAG TPA: tetratricopeptide repeat protein [Polyangia bacterium]|nr:tetratricopeptide repeat protein [Polyangia bacterium]
MRSRSFIAVVASFALVLAMNWPYRARAQSEEPQLGEARQHFEAGKSAFTAGNYPLAIREFKAAQALRPSPLLDYNIGLAHEQLGHAHVALKYYQRFLQGLPNAPNRAEVESRIARLERLVPLPAAEQPPPDAQEAPPPELPNAPPPTAANANDPYAQLAPQTSPQAQPPQAQPAPQAAAPAPKRSLWWVPLVVVGGALVIAGLILIAIYAPGTTSTTVSADRALAAPARAAPHDRTPSTFPLFHF